MNDKLNIQLAQILADVSATVGEAKTFVVAELPDVVQQLLIWYGVYYFIIFSLCVLTLASIVYIIFKYTIPAQKKWDGRSFPPALQALFAGSLPVFITFNIINLQWLKIWIAPKIWLIEYAATLSGK
ncbi:MAG: hypothetical protein U9N34_01510 [Candidatus Cloacimonadota bacterium]|nr:hypothetical protein [Candidatus Cloacimonadota bacterium]